MTLRKPKAWTKWLNLTKWRYTRTYQASLKIPPFMALHGYAPPFIIEQRGIDKKRRIGRMAGGKARNESITEGKIIGIP